MAVEFREPQQRYPQQAMPLLQALEEHDLLHVVHVVREHVVQLFLRVEGESAGMFHCQHQSQYVFIDFFLPATEYTLRSAARRKCMGVGKPPWLDCPNA